ncbi:MAG: replication-relaxation family protein [Candidatus Caldarchaeum sp.]
MPPKRLPRFKRAQDPPKIKLTPRDIRLLELVDQYRFIDSQMLKALIKLDYPDSYEDSIKRRLAKLFHNGYLARPIEQVILRLRDAKYHYIYTLAEDGAEILARRLGQDITRLKWRIGQDEASYKQIEHMMEVSRFRACLEIALAQRGEPLKLWKGDGEFTIKIKFTIKTEHQARLLRERLGSTATLGIRPDGFFQLGSNFYALEIDRGTSGLNYNAKKLLGYFKLLKLMKSKPLQLDSQTITHFRVITITPTLRRLKHLQEQARLIDDEQRGYRAFLFALETDYDIQEQDRILAPIFRSPIESDQPISLL